MAAEFATFVDAADTAIGALKAVPVAQTAGGQRVRQKVYEFIQAQVKGGNTAECAVIKDLQCIIHFDLFGTEVGQSPAQKQPITMPCGHTYCRGCIHGWRMTAHGINCPQCPGTPLPTAAALLAMPPTFAIQNICQYLVPRPPAGGRRRRATRKRSNT